MDQYLKTKEDHAKDAYIKMRQGQRELFNIEDIKIIEKDIEKSDITDTMSGYYYPKNYERVSIKDLNTEKILLAADHNTITDLITNIIEEISVLHLVSKIRRRFITNQARYIKNKAQTYKIASFDDSVNVIDFKENRDIKTYGLGISDANVRLDTLIEKKDTNVNENVSIRIIDSKGTAKNKIIGDKNSILKPHLQEGVKVMVDADTVRDIGISLILHPDTSKSKQLTIYTNNENIGSRVIVTIWNENGIEKIVYDKIVSTDIIDVIMENEVNIKKAKIDIIRNIPTQSDVGSYIYYFFIKTIKFSNPSIKGVGEYFSIPIALQENTNSFALVSDFKKPINTDIDFFIRLDDSTIWRKIQPYHKDNNKTIEGDTIYTNILNARIEKLKPNGDIWNNIEPESKYGVYLYNILNASTGNSTIGAGGVLRIEEDSEGSYRIISTDEDSLKILEDKIEVYRGINNWQITKEEILETILEEKQIINFILDRPPDDPEDGPVIGPYPEQRFEGYWFKPAPMLTTYKELVTGAGTSTVTLKYPPEEYTKENIVIYDESDKTINIKVLSISDTEITLSDNLANNTGYIIQYDVKLKGIKEKDDEYEYILDTNSIIIQEATASSEDLYTIDQDFKLLENNFEIELLKKGRYTGEPLIISYKYTKRRKKPKLLYTTHFDINSSKVINIIPFSSIEINMGNYHKINGVDISLLSAYRLDPGSYTIESTQPYPDNPSNVSLTVNSITSKKSQAGLVIPDDIIIRSHQKSLRKIDPYKLGQNIKTTDSRHFAYDNGKILINRIPEYIPKGYTSSTSNKDHITGNELRCRKTIYDPVSFKYNGQEMIPETFLIIIPYKLTDSSVKTFSCKVALSGDIENGVSPELLKLGYTEFD